MKLSGAIRSAAQSKQERDIAIKKYIIKLPLAFLPFKWNVYVIHVYAQRFLYHVEVEIVIPYLREMNKYK